VAKSECITEDPIASKFGSADEAATGERSRRGRVQQCEGGGASLYDCHCKTVKGRYGEIPPRDSPGRSRPGVVGQLGVRTKGGRRGYEKNETAFIDTERGKVRHAR